MTEEMVRHRVVEQLGEPQVMSSWEVRVHQTNQTIADILNGPPTPIVNFVHDESEWSEKRAQEDGAYFGIGLGLLMAATGLALMIYFALGGPQ